MNGETVDYRYDASKQIIIAFGMTTKVLKLTSTEFELEAENINIGEGGTTKTKGKTLFVKK